MPPPPQQASKPHPGTRGLQGSTVDDMGKWARILKQEHVVVELTSTRKFDALRELTAVLEDEAAIDDLKQFLADLILREKQSSTGIGKGVAVPHAHEDSIRREVLAIGISKQGIDFDAIDGEPVHIMALLATPTKHQKKHMELLASLSRVLQDEATRTELVAAPDAAAIIEIFTRNDD